MTLSLKRLFAFMIVGLVLMIGARPAVSQAGDGPFDPARLAALEALGIEYNADVYGTATIPYDQYRNIMDNGGLSYWAASTMPEAQARLLAEQGEQMVSVSIRLDKEPVRLTEDRRLERLEYTEEGRAMQLYKEEFLDVRDANSASVKALIESVGGVYHAEIRYLMSTILAEIPASAAPTILEHPHVTMVTQLYDAERDLFETVDFIGGTDLQNLAGVDGTGVKVGILDSGLDYTHAAFGGPGTVAFYEDYAYYGPIAVCPTGFEPECYFNQDPFDIGLMSLYGPLATTNVRGGYDFVGENWPFGDLEPDPNPIDFEGHGTHVADIIGGINGVAPGVDLYAYKVCSAVATSCSGVAIVQGLVQSYLDGMDVVNLSLGAVYGQPNDDSSHIVNLMSLGGVTVVISAGNSGDRPYVVGSPSSSLGAISVAQLSVPSAVVPVFDIYNDVAPENRVEVKNAVWQPWSPYPTDFDLPLYFDSTNPLGCTPFVGDLTGYVVLINRGACNFTLKAFHAGNAGASAVLIGLVTSEAPFSGGDGGDPVSVPTFMVSQATGDDIRARLTASSDPYMELVVANFISDAYSVVGSSSRGPRNHDNFLKPEIGAPGASVSAIAGSGSATGPFGGTSGAAPMVSGAAALLIEHFNINEGMGFNPRHFKALMMNHAETEIYLEQPGINTIDGILAPVSRIGGGQVSIGDAMDWTLLAYDITDGEDLRRTGGLSLGYQPVSENTDVVRTLRVYNIGSSSQDVEPVPTFRFANDNVGVISVGISPTDATIAAGAYQDFTFTFTIDAATLYAEKAPGGFPARSAGDAAGGANLTTYEFDGYVELQDANTSDVLATVPWHVLPKAVSDLDVTDNGVTAGTGTVDIENVGDVDASVDFYRLYEENPSWGLEVGNCASLGLPPNCDADGVDIKHVGYDDNPDFFGPADGFMFFVINTYDPPYRASQFPGTFEVYLDIDQDGIADFLVTNNDLNLLTGTPGVDGRSAVATFNLWNGAGNIFFLTNSKFNSNTYILPSYTINSGANNMTAFGLTTGGQFDFWVAAFNNYHGGYYDCAPNVPALTRPFTDSETTCASSGAFTATYGGWVFELSDYFLDIDSGFTESFDYELGVLGGTDQGVLMVNLWGPMGGETVAIPLDLGAFLTENVFLPLLRTP